MAFFTTILNLFGALPHTILPGASPSSSTESKTEVIAIYQGLAAANSDTEFTKAFRITEYPSIAGTTSNALKTAIDLAFALADETLTGLPGAPAQITAGDLDSAKAEYYNSGRTLLLTMTPKTQTADFNGKSNEGSVGHTIGVLGADIQKPLEAIAGLGLGFGLSQMSNVIKVTYSEPSVSLKVNANSGKIITAEYSYKLLIEIPLVLATLRIAGEYSLTKSLI